MMEHKEGCRRDGFTYEVGSGEPIPPCTCGADDMPEANLTSEKVVYTVNARRGGKTTKLEALWDAVRSTWEADEMPQAVYVADLCEQDYVWSLDPPERDGIVWTRYERIGRYRELAGQLRRIAALMSEHGRWHNGTYFDMKQTPKDLRLAADLLDGSTATKERRS